MAKSIYLPLVLFILFFCIQVFIKPSETALFVFVLAITILSLGLQHYKGEIKLFFLGLVLGFIIEVGLGLISRQQYWDDASLLGVPMWLPLIWGIGFVAITRVGIRLRGIQ